MIHVRLSAEMHKKLRVRAAELDTSIQNLVESLIGKALNRDRKESV
jgi:predicted HicB family RNase H-like nuclease